MPTKDPTEEAPELGVITLFGVTLSDGERWVEDGANIFRSTEFDVIAYGATFEEGLHRFGTALIDFMVYLADLADPAENERAMLRLLQRRVAQVAERGKAKVDEQACGEPARLATATRSRMRGDHASQWQTTAKRRDSRAKSHA
jgi:hypothetical protein